MSSFSWQLAVGSWQLAVNATCRISMGFAEKKKGKVL